MSTDNPSEGVISHEAAPSRGRRLNAKKNGKEAPGPTEKPPADSVKETPATSVKAFRPVTPWHKRPYDVLLFGPTGFTGRRVLERLSKMDLSVAIAGRDPEELSKLVAQYDGVQLAMKADVEDHESLVNAFKEARVVINCVGPYLDYGHLAVDAAIEARTFIIDPSGEQPWMNQLYRRHRDISEAGILAISGQAAMPALGDLAVYLLQPMFEEVKTVRLGYMTGDSSPAKGTLKAMARYLGEPGMVYENGYWRVARLGELSHNFKHNKEKMPAVSYPVGETVMVPRHLDLENVIGYIITQGPGSSLLKHSLPQVMRLLTPELGKAIGDLVARLPEGLFQSADDHNNHCTTLIEMEGSLGGEPLRIRASIGAEDAYDITADLLAFGAYFLVYSPPRPRGALTPAQAFDGFRLIQMLKSRGLSISGALQDVLSGFGAMQV